MAAQQQFDPVMPVRGRWHENLDHGTRGAAAGFIVHLAQRRAADKAPGSGRPCSERGGWDRPDSPSPVMPASRSAIMYS